MGSHIMIAIIIGLIVAGIVALIYKGELHSVSIKREASNYIKQNSLKLEVNRDYYICTNVKRTARPKPQQSQQQSK